MLIDRVSAMSEIAAKANADRLVSLADVRDALNSLEGIDPATLAPRWVSVEERLPNPRTVCLGYYKHSYCDNDGFWIISTVLFDGEKFKVGSDYKVTHWMELPEPPKEGENDGENE